MFIEYGSKGSCLITDTEKHTGCWRMIAVKETTEFTTLTDATRTGNSIASESWPANHIIYGVITEIKLASGAVVAYD